MILPPFTPEVLHRSGRSTLFLPLYAPFCTPNLLTSNLTLSLSLGKIPPTPPLCKTKPAFSSAKSSLPLHVPPAGKGNAGSQLGIWAPLLLSTTFAVAGPIGISGSSALGIGWAKGISAVEVTKLERFLRRVDRSGQCWRSDAPEKPRREEISWSALTMS